MIFRGDVFVESITTKIGCDLFDNEIMVKEIQAL